MDDLIDPTEMYLKAVLECEEAGVVPLRARLAERLEQAPSTVTQTVGRMVRDGLFISVPGDRQLYLSPHGRHLALQIMRKHRLAEGLLTDVIGLEWSWAHEEACRWEHVMSDAATEHIAELLGHPEHSPYGNWIPTTREVERGFTWNPVSAGLVNALRYTFDGEPQTPALLRCIGESVQADPRLLERMASSGLVPGARVLIERHGPGVRVCAVDAPDGGLELGHVNASQIFVSDEQAPDAQVSDA